jgi:hypothetical protein
VRHTNKRNYIGYITGRECCDLKEWWGGKNKLPTLSKKDKANGKKIKQVV